MEYLLPPPYLSVVLITRPIQVEYLLLAPIQFEYCMDQLLLAVATYSSGVFITSQLFWYCIEHFLLATYSSGVSNTSHLLNSTMVSRGGAHPHASFTRTESALVAVGGGEADEAVTVQPDKTSSSARRLQLASSGRRLID